LSAAPAGTCRIWGWSYRGLPNPVLGASIQTLNDDPCEEISDNFITVIRESQGGNPCDNLGISTNNNGIIISNLVSDYVDIQIFDTDNGYSTVFTCSGGQCHQPEQIVNLPVGNYAVKVKLYDQVEHGGLIFLCERNENITIGSTSNAIINEQDVFYFSAVQADRNVALHWGVNTEFKTDYFMVERSSDGVNFTTLFEEKELEARTRVVTYNSIDDLANFGMNYYRINQIFNDGTSRYSAIKSVDFGINLEDDNLYPNPAIDQVNLNLIEFEGRMVDIKIYNQLGVLMFDKKEIEITDNPLSFNLTGYTPGMYILSIKIQDRRISSKSFFISGF